MTEGSFLLYLYITMRTGTRFYWLIPLRTVRLLLKTICSCISYHSRATDYSDSRTQDLTEAEFNSPITTNPETTVPSIRPISPATLIALTEPYLMDWCFRLDSGPLETLAGGNLELNGLPFDDATYNTNKNDWGY